MTSARFWHPPKPDTKQRSKSSSPAVSTAENQDDTIEDEKPRRPSSIASNHVEAVLEEAKQQTAEAEGEDDIEYPRAWKLTAITAALMLSVFCMALDNTIIATAIPRITDQFNSIGDVGWYGSAYLLTTCAFQLSFGKLYTFYSIKWVYLSAFGIFELGSLVCAVAPSSVALIVGRAVAGLGAAGIFSGAILIIAHTVPLKQRSIFTGFIASMYGLASVAGPLLGGVFTDKVSWRWCFYINLPLGALTAAFIVIFFKAPTKGGQQAGLGWRQKVQQLDPLGTLVFVPAIVVLLLALQWGGSKYDWGSYRIIICFVFFGVLIIAFLLIQWWQQENATVPPRVFKQRTVWSAATFAALLGASFFVMIYYLPIWFQAIKGVSATKSGIMNLALLLGLVITSLVGGGLTTAFGQYMPFIFSSSVLMSIGAGLITTFTTSTGHSQWIGYSCIYGFGVGFGMQLPVIAVQVALPLKDVPIGTATVMFSQTLGGALSVSIGQNVFSNQLIKNVMKDVPNVDPTLVLAVGATSLKGAIPAQYLSRVLTAYNDTLTQVFYVSVATACLSILGAAFMEWRSVKGKKIEAAAA